MRKKNILIVEDEIFNRELLCSMVNQIGYHSIPASNGEEAINLVNKETDLILLDVLMPGIDGFEVIKTIRSKPEVSDIPIIMVTSLSNKEDRLRSVELGANDFITKPVDRTELRVRVNSLLKMKEVQDEIKLHKQHLEEIVKKRTAELELKNAELEKEICERIKSEKELRRIQKNLAEAQQIAHLGSWTWDIVENNLMWSDEVYRIFGLAPQEFGATYEAFLSFVHPDDREPVDQAVRKALENCEPYEIEHRVIRPDQTLRIVLEQGVVTYDSSGKPIRMVGTIQDITERKQIEAELKKLYRAIEESINLIFITDASGKIEYVNPMFEQITGYHRDEAIGKTPSILSCGETSKEVYSDLWKTILSGKTWRGTLKNKRKDGKFYWWRGIISPIRNETGTITHFLSIQEDITEKIIAEQRANYLATHDLVTGLANRNTFFEKIEELMIISKNGVVILVNIDGFRLINETYGHTLGDELLKRMAGLIKKTLEEMYGETNYYVARIDKDEFAICLPEVDGKKGKIIAEQIRLNTESIRFSDESIGITISAGVVLFPAHANRTKDLMSKADAALMHAKRMGKNRIYFYNEEDRILEDSKTRAKQRELILWGLDEDLFVPWFQPIMDLKDDSIHHYEALARMKTHDGNIILPGEFIGTAENLGLISKIDKMIAEKTIRFLANQNKKGKYLTIAMNISAKHIGDEEMLDLIRFNVSETGIRPSQLVFEITETAAIEDFELAKSFVSSLKSIGCRFALDDFGVGYTSFFYLREMQVDYIKIDGLFVRRLHEKKEDQGIVNAISTIARNLQIKTIAEFVEKKETLRLLKSFQVDYAQGFLIGKPAPDVI